ncbi:GNAT family N-acetyltransferase [Catellatospora sp. NPDC049609]|uniref:GNAT family N-acetyltransferase n=1 Tax=Catellatospora sp. NPDC049609 TaxID=3155505 RepID=UPI003430756D
MSHPAYPLRTERLLLRPFTADDLDDVWAYQRLPEVARYTLAEPRSREQSLSSVRAMAAETALVREGDCLTLAVVWPAAGSVIGQVELVWRSEQSRQGEIGYVLHPDHQGRGLAAEAARAMLRWGFEEFGLHRIYGRCNALNTASAALLARLGMRREAHLLDSAFVKDAWRDEYVYAMLARDWPRSSGGTTHDPHCPQGADQPDATREAASKAEIDALTAEFYGAFDNRDGRAPDVDRIRRLVIAGGTIVKTGPEYTVYTVEEFIAPRRRLLTDGGLVGFSEWETAARTEIAGDIACRFGQYRKSGTLDGKPFEGGGTKTMQFVRTPQGWRIAALAWCDQS